MFRESAKPAFEAPDTDCLIYHMGQAFNLGGDERSIGKVMASIASSGEIPNGATLKCRIPGCETTVILRDFQVVLDESNHEDCLEQEPLILPPHSIA